MNWIVEDSFSREATMEHLPQLGGPFLAMYQSLWSQPHVPAGLLELCRLRMAQLHRSETDQTLAVVPVDAQRRAALRDWHSSPLFTDAERACLEFTEIYAMDALAITDQQAEAVKAHYGDVGLVALVQSLGVFDGLQRLGLIWQTSQQEA